MRRKAVVGATVAVLSLAATACGTTLPDSAFTGATNAPVVSSQTGNQSTQPGLPSGVQPTGSNGIQTTTGTNGTAGSKGTSGRTISEGGSGPQQPGAGGGSCSGATWSGPGVAGNTVKIGEIVSGPANAFSPNQFIPSYYGANSYFHYVDAQGGLCGKQVQYIKCDDNGDRNQDVACAHQLIDQDKVFALVATNVFDYAGASYVSQTGTPDVGGEPITGDAYYSYPHLYSILGSYYLNNGQPPKEFWGLSGLGEFFKSHLHLSRVGIVFYAQATSQRGARYVEGWLTHAGVKVDDEQVPLAGDPSPQVQDMKNRGDQAVFVAVDLNGSQRICQSMQNYQYDVPSVGLIAEWTDDFAQAIGRYDCAKNYYAWGQSTNYEDTSNPLVRTFQQAYASFAPGAPRGQWSLEGWVAGMFFADAVKSCARKGITRSCIESFVNTKTGYSAQGLIDPNTLFFPHWSNHPATAKQCYTIVKWSGGTSGSWSTVADHSNNCFTTPFFSYATGG